LTADLAIGLKWVFWEQYEEPPGAKKQPTAAEFNKYMQKLGWFHDYFTYWQLWQGLTISTLEYYFMNKETNQVPLFMITKEGETS
jgi:hypothetical protein